MTTTSVVDAESVLTLEIGSITTRALLFDEAEGQYHFIANGSAPSTVDAPISNLSEGVHQALLSLQEKSGKVLMEEDGQLIIPSRQDGWGIDKLVVTFSAGPTIKIIVMGLLGDVSLNSAERLAATTYAEVADVISLNDRRGTAAQFDSILHHEPNLIILTGGTDGGASKSVYKMAELVSLVIRMLPKEKLPELLYAGNADLAQKVEDGLGKILHVITTPNVRPTVDLETLLPAQETLAQMVTGLRMKQIGGMRDLISLSAIPPLPSAHTFSRMVRFLSRLYGDANPVLGIDIGASHSTICAVQGEKESTNVLPVGLGNGLKKFLEETNLEDVAYWMTNPLPIESIRDYLYQKQIFPHMLPVTPETLAIEQAVARHILRHYVPGILQANNISHTFEPILLSGSVFALAPTPAQALLMLLDGLQPVGISTIVLDKHNLASALGAIATLNSILPVQVLESSAFINLATVISPICDARYGTPILRVRMDYGDKKTTKVDIKQGTITMLPLQPGQIANIRFEPLRRVVIDPLRQVGAFKIVGGICGAVIDTRGRPLLLPRDPGKRSELLKRWVSSFEE